MAGLAHISFTVKDNKYYFRYPIPFEFNEEINNIGDITIAISEFSETELFDIINKYPNGDDFTVLEHFREFTDWLFKELVNSNHGYAVSFFIANMFLYYFFVFRFKKDYFIEQITDMQKNKQLFSGIDLDFLKAEEIIKTLIDMISIWVVTEINTYKSFIPEILLKDIKSENFITSMNLLFINPLTSLELNAGIKYEITSGVEDKFIEVFSVANLSDFLKFEFCHIIKNKIPLTECSNCGRLFIPQKRSDTMYCNHSAPQDESMTCKEYGAKRLWYEKLKENKATKLYRNIYMAKQMLAKNNPGVKEYRKDFEEYKVNSIKWKKDVKDGRKTDEEFLIWLNSVKGKRGSN